MVLSWLAPHCVLPALPPPPTPTTSLGLALTVPRVPMRPMSIRFQARGERHVIYTEVEFAARVPENGYPVSQQPLDVSERTQYAVLNTKLTKVRTGESRRHM